MPPKSKKAPAKRPVLTKEVVASHPSWILRTDNVELAVTELGAHMAPVTFARNAGGVQPYYIAPWHAESLKDADPVLQILRGDFFCLPFGSNGTPYKGQAHPLHGESASSKWSLVGANQDDDSSSLHIRMDLKIRPGTVHRQFTLIKGHDAVYNRTLVEGYSGAASFAHHATLRMPKTERALRISTSPFDLGRTFPLVLQNPSIGDYQWLEPDAPFKSLSSVPSMYKHEGPADCSAFPTRPGFCDLLQQFEKPSKKPNISWVTAVNNEENWVWFALKNPAQMPNRLYWIENRGRHSAPWNGRNNCLGIEDGCMYFDRSIADCKKPNPVNKLGVQTFVDFKPKQPLEIRYIQGAVKVPAGFDKVAIVDFVPEGIVLHSTKGKKVSVPLDHGFLL